MPVPATDDLFEWTLTEALFATPSSLFLTAWAGHIPFLFALVKLARPRTYVELGVHFGGSFVAACSASSRYRTGTMCFGIDNWEGDQHAGSYDGNKAFHDLLAYLQKHFPTATLYRENFNDALSHFENGSIDILHFDGFHTFNAIQEDFAAWSPKLSRRGIALFHDISLREAEFGVWKFWEQLKPTYRTMEFYHSAGLGVAFIGPDQPPPVQRLLSLWETNDPFRELFRTTCEHIGHLLPSRMENSSANALKLVATQSRILKLMYKAFRRVGSLAK
jgi:Methyltransferase domain